eukprot:scaffold159673_cov19-Tisochrysis_lutea.AAC.1
MLPSGPCRHSGGRGPKDLGVCVQAAWNTEPGVKHCTGVLKHWRINSRSTWHRGIWVSQWQKTAQPLTHGYLSPPSKKGAGEGKRVRAYQTVPCQYWQE